MGNHEVHGFALNGTPKKHAQVDRCAGDASHGDPLTPQHLASIAQVDGPELLVVEVGNEGRHVSEKGTTVVDNHLFVISDFTMHTPSELKGGHEGGGFGWPYAFDSAQLTEFHLGKVGEAVACLGEDLLGNLNDTFASQSASQ